MPREHFPIILDHHNEHEKAKDEIGALSDGHHDTDLYDLDESLIGGEKTDLATGVTINNSGEAGAPVTHQLIDIDAGPRKDALPPLKEKRDAAALWLEQNDPTRRQA